MAFLLLTARARLVIVGASALATLLSWGGVAVAAGPAANVAIQLSPASIAADGSSTSTVTATVTDANVMPVPGESVVMFTSDRGITLTPNPARDNGDGTYTATLKSSFVAGKIAVSAVDQLAVVHPALLTQTAASTTSLAAVTTAPVTSTNPPVTNQGVTLVASVTSTPANVAPSGMVAFENRGTPISGCAAVPTPPQPSPSVIVTCGTSFAAATSPVQLTAVFTPTPGSLVTGSTSPAEGFPINKESTSTSLTVLSSTAHVGVAVRFAALVAPSHPGSLRPAGSVRFANDGRAISSCSGRPLARSSTATCTVTYETPGAHAITASYGGDDSFDGSASGSATVTVQALGTISATMQWAFDYTPTYTRIVSLIINGAPPGATVLLKCRGRRCPFAKRTIAARKTKLCGPRGRLRCATHGTIDLTRGFRQKRLPVGTRITVQITKRGWVGKSYTFTVRARGNPSVQIT